MPRRTPTQTARQPVIPTNSLVASATRYAGEATRIYQPSQDWQVRCYRHYAICGEARFAARFFGHAMSRAVLSVSSIQPDGSLSPDTSGTAHEALHALFNGADGQAQMLEAVGIHLTIAGECYLVGREVDGVDVWEVISTLEVKVNGSKWTIAYGDGRPDVPLVKEDVVIRIWMPNPAKRMEADSPFRSLLPVLDEVEWLTKHIFSQTTSRLAGNGILFLPQEMTFPAPVDAEGNAVETTNDADAFMLTLADGMLTPLENQASPASKVPIVVTAPTDAIQAARWMTFWSELDAAALEMRSDAIRRFALGMDLPPEQVLGMSSNAGTGGGTSNGVSHWGAWQIEEGTIKMHVEPILELVVNALTIAYLRPLVDDPTKVVRYSTAALRLRPDRSREAIELWDRGVLKTSTMLREVGFEPDDEVDEVEHKNWLLRKIASGSATPEQVAAALRALGVDLGTPGESEEAPRESRPAPTLDDHPSKPRTPGEASALLAASEALVFRALERAGNRLRNTGAKPPNVPAYETHVYVHANGNADHLLDDAWPTASLVLDGIADADEVIPVLNSYCRTLMAEGSPHSRERLVQWLSLGAKP